MQTDQKVQKAQKHTDLMKEYLCVGLNNQQGATIRSELALMLFSAGQLRFLKLHCLL